MANNPYSPPTAEVISQAASPVGRRPMTVYIGTAIIAVMAAYALLTWALTPNLAVRFENVRNQGGLGYMVFLPLAILLLQTISVVFAFLRKNWARFTLLVVFAWGVLTMLAQVYSFVSVLHRGTLADLVPLVALSWTVGIVRGVSIGLLFTPSANAWFRARAPR